MDKKEWLKEICNKCPIDQVIKNCYNSVCNIYKCYDNLINKKPPFDDMADRQESIEIINKILKENGLD